MAAPPIVRLISYSHEIFDGKPIYVSSNSLPIKALKFEPAGHSFHVAALRLLGCYEEETGDGDSQNISDDKEHDDMQSSYSYSSKGKKNREGGTQQDHYALLGLGHLRYLATEDQIRKSYRETALKHHPDKQAALILAEETESSKQAKKDEIENHFKAIQEAYEVLIDPVRRRIIDSTDEFDDDVPTDCAPHEFFKVFGSAFMRNGRWSINQPIPSLGDDNTPIKEVDAFYNFWYTFKSWREFPHADEFDLEQAESRDHKRWMERQNVKLTEKARKEEYTRIRLLVDNAYKRDPRILRTKEQEKAEKQKKKEAKYLAKKLQEEEAVKIAEEERHKKEKVEKQAAEAALHQKKTKEKEKKLLRKERTRLRILSNLVLSQHLLGLVEDDVESLCMSLGIDQLKSLCDSLERKEEYEKAQLLKEALSMEDNNEQIDWKNKDEQNGSMKTNGNIFANDHVNREKTWSKEEIDLLRKGMQKYPKGTSRRWEVISEYIGTNRSVEEILKATKTVLLQKPDSAKAFDSFLEKRKPVQSISSPLTTREELEGVSSISRPLTETLKVEDDAAVANGHSVLLNSEQDVWSAVQETALIQALKAFPKETTQRWERVATAVPGKTVNQCKKKFSLLKENFRNKKQNG